MQGGRIIDPAQGVDMIGSLLISEGKISWLGEVGADPPASDYDVLPAKGLVVSPGFIDFHCHLRQPGFEEKETIATGSRAAAKGGFTTVCCMPNTRPPLDNGFTIDYLKIEIAREGVIRVLPIGCISEGRRGKKLAPLSELAAVGVIGFSDDGAPVMDATVMRQALEFSCTLGLPIIDHCEHTDLTQGGVMNRGKLSVRLGLRGMTAIAEEMMVDRDIALARVTGGWLHVAHVSTEGSVDLIRRARERGIKVTAEVTPHHLTLTEEMVTLSGTNAKVNPPLRTERDTQTLLAGLKEGVIDIIATDHAPHTEADKRCDFAQAAFGISGFETAFGSLMGLVHEGKMTLPVLIARLTAGPARIIGDKYGKLGTLVPGAPADVTVFDPDRSWLVDTSEFLSKGRNTPLAGSVLKGKVVATISQGKLVYKDNSITVESAAGRITEEV